MPNWAYEVWPSDFARSRHGVSHDLGTFAEALARLRLLLELPLACHFTPSYRAQDVTAALDAAQGEAEPVHGPLAKMPFLVTDNGSNFIV